MFTTNTLELLLNKLPKAAREAHEAPTITNNLVSVSVLCDAGCEVFFHGQGCEITFNGETIVRGWRDLTTNMWRISLLPDGGNNIIPADDGTSDITSEVIMPEFLANSIYECETTGQLIHFYHATMGYPVVSTWCKAIDAGYFRGWPGLTSKRVRKFIMSAKPRWAIWTNAEWAFAPRKSSQNQNRTQWNIFPKLLSMKKLIMFTCPLQMSKAGSTVTKLADSQSLPTEAIVMSSFFM